MIEGPTLFALVVYLISSHLFFLAIAGLMIFIFITKKPSKNSVSKELELDMQEQRNLDNDEMIIT